MVAEARGCESGFPNSDVAINASREDVWKLAIEADFHFLTYSSPQSVSPCYSLEFYSDSVLDGNHGSSLEFKGWEGRAYLVNGRRIVAVN